ncbi:MAG: hypothetical protein P8I91_04460 [Phycisphaerales bacterium]|nr:hypothetical protein [Phycisphaerales bacterium]
MSKIPTTLAGVDGPMSLIGRQVKQSLDCLACGYELEGSAADGRCPECGLPVPFSLAGSIDPEAHRLPPLENAVLVGRGLLLGACALTVVASSVFVLSIRESFTLAGRPTAGWPSWPWWPLAAAVVGLGLLGWWSIRPQKGRQDSLGSCWSITTFLVGILLSAGAMATAGGGFQWASGQVATILAAVLPLPGLAIGLVGFRGVLLELGRRSRQFRSSAVRRQRIPSLLVAIGIVAAAWVALLILLEVGERDSTYGVIPVAIGLTAMLFVVVGHWYLLVNAWWIRGDLCRPPQKLGALLSEVASSSPDSLIAANLADLGKQPSEPVSGHSVLEDQSSPE